MNTTAFISNFSEAKAFAIKENISNLFNNIETFKNGNELYEALKVKEIEFLLLDLNLPGKNPYLILNEINNYYQNKVKHIGIILQNINHNQIYHLRNNEYDFNVNN
ncbi:MAG: hypothetical protein LBM99_02825, partial [Bacillales bacterium]|nr:hypothetical protein [Bacillales bacterium]